MSVTMKPSAAKAIQWVKDHRLPGNGVMTNHKLSVASQATDSL